jgi:serine phosphatase RsbU (regulator of sigma subunit)
VTASPQERAGLPISVKLVLTTSIVVAVAVAAATWFTQRSIVQLAHAQAQARQTAGEKAITRQSDLLVQSMANAIAHPLGGNEINDVQPAIDRALHDDREHQLQWVLITDQSGPVPVRPAPPSGTKLGDLDALLATGIKDGDVVHAHIGSGADWVYAAPIYLANLNLGTIRIGVTTAALQAELEASIAEAEDAARDSRDKLFVIAALVLGIGILVAALQGVGMARPIRALTVQASRVASGDLQSRVPETRSDELGVLARTFNFMSDAMVQLLAQNAQQASLEKEMELARQVQQAMLPPAALDQHGYFKVIGYCMPASQCGGDWWMYRKLSNGRMLLVVGDATGHGIHSAMIAATARGAVEALAAADERLLQPEQVLRAIDQAIAMVGEHNVLMTAFCAVFDSQSGVLQYANAGQNFPYVIKLGASRVLEDASIIAASGNPLGDRNIHVEIRRGSLQLRAGDLFVCFTDGVVERANPAGKLFGDRRLRGALTGQPLQDAGALVHLRDRVLAALDAHAEGELAGDDITFVLCQFDPPPARASGRAA